MEIILSLLFELILSIIAVVASKHLIPWLKEKKLSEAAKIAVEAAEQLIGSGKGQEKYDQASEWLGKKFNLSEEEVKKLIESAVYQMKNKNNTSII